MKPSERNAVTDPGRPGFLETNAGILVSFGLLGPVPLRVLGVEGVAVVGDLLGLGRVHTT